MISATHQAAMLCLTLVAYYYTVSLRVISAEYCTVRSCMISFSYYTVRLYVISSAYYCIILCKISAAYHTIILYMILVSYYTVRLCTLWSYMISAVYYALGLYIISAAYCIVRLFMISEKMQMRGSGCVTSGTSGLMMFSLQHLWIQRMTLRTTQRRQMFTQPSVLMHLPRMTRRKRRTVLGTIFFFSVLFFWIVLLKFVLC